MIVQQTHSYPIYIYTYLYVCIYTYLYVCIYIYIYIYVTKMLLRYHLFHPIKKTYPRRRCESSWKACCASACRFASDGVHRSPSFWTKKQCDFTKKKCDFLFCRSVQVILNVILIDYNCIYICMYLWLDVHRCSRKI